MDKTMDLLKGRIRELNEVANVSASELEGSAASPGLTPQTPGPVTTGPFG